MQKYTLQNLDCANCAARIEDALQKTPGVRFASVDFATTTLSLEADDIARAKETIRQVEPEVHIRRKEDGGGADFDVREALAPILAAAVLFVSGLVFYERLADTAYAWGVYAVFGAAYLISGQGVLASALRNIARGRVFDEHFLMSVATLGAIVIGEIPEAVGVMLFYQVGEFLQRLAVHRSRKSIQALLQVRPDTARLLEDGKPREVRPETVRVGEMILVRPGEKIPLDGEVLTGNSLVDTAPLTGESVPQKRGPGDPVLAGAINQSGLLTLRVTRPFGESSISKILELVESASSRKAKTERFISRFARVYSPIVVFGAVGVALVPPLFFGASLTEWVYRALVVLVISCPCALVISIPLGYFGGVGGASRRGILVKGSNFLDSLAAVRRVIFDKTGTLTRGVFEVTRVVPRNGYSQADLLHFAAQAEAGSNHPIAQSIRRAYGGLDQSVPAAQGFEEIAGHGVQTIVDGRALMAGNDLLLHRENIAHDSALCEIAGTVVHVVVDGTHAGCLVISDQPKADAARAVRELRLAGVEEIVMLTGDTEAAADRVARSLGLDHYQAELLPEDKVTSVEEILAGAKGKGKVAFVGDGINDAPALARADVGIAMGALGSEAAIETADVVIMTDSPAKVAEAIRLGRKTRRIVWQNIAMALVIKGVFIALGVAGEASMWQAVFGDMGVALLAVLNAARALR